MENLSMEEIFKKDFNETEVLIENGDDIEEVVEEVEFNGYYDIYDVLIRTNEFDKSIIEEEIKVHAEKRYNRKYINARKHLIKDKRHLFAKVKPYSTKNMDNNLTTKNILSVDNLCFVKEKMNEKVSEYNINYVEISFSNVDWLKSSLGGIKENMSYSGPCIIIENNEEYFTFIRYSKYIDINGFYSNDYIYDHMISIEKEKINYLFIDKKNLGLIKIKRIINYSIDSVINVNNARTHFYGKLVKGGSFIGNIKLQKRPIEYYIDYIDLESYKRDNKKQIRKEFNIYLQEIEDRKNEPIYNPNLLYLDDLYHDLPVNEFLGMNIFYYEDNENYDLLEKYEELKTKYNFTENEIDSYFSEEDLEFFSDMYEEYEEYWD